MSTIAVGARLCVTRDAACKQPNDDDATKHVPTRIPEISGSSWKNHDGYQRRTIPPPTQKNSHTITAGLAFVTRDCYYNYLSIILSRTVTLSHVVACALFCL